MGYAGNTEPQYIIPTVIGTTTEDADNQSLQDGAMGDIDFHVGENVLANGLTHQTSNPIRNGLIENWDSMEHLWGRCMFEYLRCEPEEHIFMLSEPPLSPPDNREFTAEIMFETFNVSGLQIAVDAVLALQASWGVVRVHYFRFRRLLW